MKNTETFIFSIAFQSFNIFHVTPHFSGQIYVNVQSADSQPKKYLLSHHKLVFWFLSLWQEKNCGFFYFINKNQYFQFQSQGTCLKLVS